MTSGEVRVETDDLTAKAGQIEAMAWPDAASQVPLITPDALVISSVAISNLANNAEGLWSFQEYGRLEGLRLAESLRLVAGAYERVDQQATRDIDSTMRGGGAGVLPENPETSEMPGPNTLPEPPRPSEMRAVEQQPADGPVNLVPEAQRALLAGDQAASLRAAATQWRQNSTSLAAAAQQYDVSAVDWEGEAADAAYSKFAAYRTWLVGISGDWNSLAAEADRLADAHFNALAQHTPIFERYMTLQTQLDTVPSDDPGAAASIIGKMAELQRQSEQVRDEYSTEGQPQQIKPHDPPPGAAPGIPVTASGDRARRASGTPGNESQSAGSGQPLPPAASSNARDGSQTPAKASPAAAQSGEGQRGGSPSSGGSPSGGGAPGSAAPGSSPGNSHGKGEPKAPVDPQLRPAAASRGGGTGAGGGGGGGVPASPLQPAVSAETVAPAPAVEAAKGSAAAVPATAGGGAMGGGMAPMAHGAGPGGASEKKRNPAVAQDEDIYTEERPWTEAVIGNRRRRGTPDGKKESQ